MKRQVLALLICLLGLTLNSCSSFLSVMAVDAANDLANGTTYKQMKAQEKARAKQVLDHY